jgi:RND family efflux transporter MFP subunit
LIIEYYLPRITPSTEREILNISLTVSLSLLLLGVAMLNNLAAAPAKGKVRASPVVVVEAKMHHLAPVSWVAGTVISRNDARLAAEVEGRLEKVVQVGKRVRQGDVVARIDNAFNKLRIEELRAAVERERAQLKFLRLDLKRLRKLAKQNNAAQTKLEQTEANKDISRHDLSIAQTRLNFAKLEKDRHVIRAPFAGVIAHRYLNRGERAKIGDDVVRLIDPLSLEVQARVPLSTLNYVVEGAQLQLRADNGHRKIIQGEVNALVPFGDERSRLLDMRLNFEFPGWRVGQPVRVAIPTAASKDVLAVPRDALVMRRAGTAIFRVLQDNSVEKISVQLGIATGDLIEVSGKIKPGDQVVIRGGERLRPGATVKVISK